MARVIAAAAVVAALLATAPATAGTYCVPDVAFCQPVPLIHGEAGFAYVSFDDDAPGGLALMKTGVDMSKPFDLGDTRSQICVHGACSEYFGYIVFTDSGYCGGGLFCIQTYTNGQCRQFAQHHGWIPTGCHNHNA